MKQLFAALLGLALTAGLTLGSQDLASELVKDTSERMLRTLEVRRGELERSPRLIYELVGEIVVQQFDFERITRSALGRHWRKASPQQRLILIEQFQEMLVRTYATALLNYSGQQIRYLPLKPGRGAGDVTVSTEVQEPGAPPIPIKYQLHLKHGNWKVYDVQIDGVSLVSNYRSSFAALIRRGGIDGLIDRLQSQNSVGQG
jgi:phospholipid transport system substrate-binding protein